jgi:hypothetical protein
MRAIGGPAAVALVLLLALACAGAGAGGADGDGEGLSLIVGGVFTLDGEPTALARYSAETDS